jgi:hypothetical protein
MLAYNAEVPLPRRRGVTNRRAAKTVKCIVSTGNRITLALARKLGWPTNEIGQRVEIELPEDWAARVVAETPMRADICLAVLRRGLAAAS